LRFRPGLWATLCTLPALALLLGLGTWQLFRLEEKTRLIAEVDAGLAASPVPLPAGGLEGLAWRRVAVAGRFRHAAEMHLVGRAREGVPGTEVATPLELDDGRLLLVDRGFVPQARMSDAGWRPEGRVELAGVLRAAQRAGDFTPADRPERNEWFRIDPAAMGAAQGLALLPLYLQAQPGPRGSLPEGRPARPEIRNEHLNYALTWYGLAATLLAVYVAYHLRRDGA